MQSIDNKILSRVYGNGKGYVFSSSDFISEFSIKNIDMALSTLNKQNKIRRIARGMYDYPKFSELLKQELSPDIDKVAKAYARKFNWRIQISGDSALNILGLSTQIQGKYIYLSDGPNRKYKIFNTDLEFKKSKLKDIGFKYNDSALIVQALKSLGKEYIDNLVIEKIQNKIDTKMYDKILKDTKTTTTWIYEYIKQICKKEEK
jgi:hypothetical protein